MRKLKVGKATAVTGDRSPLSTFWSSHASNTFSLFISGLFFCPGPTESSGRASDREALGCVGSKGS